MVGRYKAFGGSKDGETFTILHGGSVLFAGTGEKYRILQEPNDYRPGAMVPEEMPDDEARLLVQKKRNFSFSK